MVDPGRILRAAAEGPRGLVLAFSFTIGLITALGQKPFGVWPATIAGLLVAYALMRGAHRVRRAGLIGWGVGTGYFGLTLIWIVQPFLVDIARHGWMAPFALFFMAGGLALFWAAGFAFSRWLAHGYLGWLAWGGGMGAVELARGVVFTGFPWGGPAMVWVDTPLLKLSAWIGASGLGLLTFLATGAIMGAFRSTHQARNLSLVGLCCAAAFIGANSSETAVTELVSEPVTLRLVQPNAAQHLKWHPDHAMRFVERELELTGAGTDPGSAPPDLIIWPETALPFLLENSWQIIEEAMELSDGVPLVLGIVRGDGGRYYNSLVAVGADASPTAIYDKHHLVPFGEYIPLGNLLHRIGIKGFAAQHGYGYSPGPGARVVDLGPSGKALPLICYEAIFPRDLRAAPERADWILQITNDAWFGTFSGPQQHLVQARFRAVEMGLPFVRAANTGISAVIDANGRVEAALPLGVHGKLDTRLPPPGLRTLYSRFGDAPVVLFLILAAALLFMDKSQNRIDPRGPAK